MESELKCPICHDFYNDPVLFPCAHSLCRQCLRGIFSAKVNQAYASRKRSLERMLIPCPSCRKEVNLSSNEIDSMQSNFLLSNIVIKYKESIQDVKDPTPFDVVKTRIDNSNSDYVRMKKPDEIEDIEDENPYVRMDGPKRLSKLFVKPEDSVNDPLYEELNIKKKPPECLPRTERHLSLPNPVPRRSLVDNFSESCAINTFSAPMCPIDERPPLPAPRSPSPAPRWSKPTTPDVIQQRIISDLARQAAQEASKGFLKPDSLPRSLNNRHSMHLPVNEDGTITVRKNAIRRKSDTTDLRQFQASKGLLRKKSPMDEKVTPINEVLSTDQGSPSNDVTNRLSRDQPRRLSNPPIPGPKPTKKEIARIKRASTFE